jgi:hypothetical protein
VEEAMVRVSVKLRRGLFESLVNIGNGREIALGAVWLGEHVGGGLETSIFEVAIQLGNAGVRGTGQTVIVQ